MSIKINNKNLSKMYIGTPPTDATEISMSSTDSKTVADVIYENKNNIISLNQSLSGVIESLGNVDDTVKTPVQLQGKDMVARVNEVFQSASDGKATVATAITGMGVLTDPTDSYGTMANNIGKITTGIDTGDADAQAAELLINKAAYVQGKKVTGTMPNKGAVNKTLTQSGEVFMIPAGYHNGSGKVTGATAQELGAFSVMPRVKNETTGNTYTFNLPKNCEIYSDGNITVSIGSYTAITGGIITNAAGTIEFKVLPHWEVSVYYGNTLLYINSNDIISKGESRLRGLPCPGYLQMTANLMMPTLNGSIYFFSLGRNNSSGYGDYFVYSYNGKTFTEIGFLPVQAGSSNYISIGGIWIHNGCIHFSLMNATKYRGTEYIFRLNSNGTFTLIMQNDTSNGYPNRCFHVVKLNNTLYAFGLYLTDSSNVDTRHCEVHIYDGGTGFTKVADFPWNQDYLGVCVHDGKIYAGSQEKLYTFNGSTWTSISAPPVSNWYRIIFGSYNGKMIAISSNNNYFIWDSDAKWTNIVGVDLLPRTAGILNNKLIGISGNNNVVLISEIFNGYQKSGTTINGRKSTTTGVQAVPLENPILVS